MSSDFLRRLAERTLGDRPVGKSQRLAPIAPARFDTTSDDFDLDTAEERLVPNRSLRGDAASGLTAHDQPSTGLAAQPTGFGDADERAISAPDRDRSNSERSHPPEVRRSTAEPLVERELLLVEATPARPALPEVTKLRPPPAASARAAIHDRQAPPNARIAKDPAPLLPVSDTPESIRRYRRETGEKPRPAEPPTVTVRIGRVDVYAAVASKPQPVAPAPRQAARPSLADHLQARNEGRK
jgi:hypothetical protein